MNQMQPIAKIRIPKRIPKNPTVAVLVVGLPHCEVITPKEVIARRMPIPIVIRTGFHETFSGAGPASIYVSLKRRARTKLATERLRERDDSMLQTSGKWNNALCSSRQCDLLISPKIRAGQGFGAVILSSDPDNTDWQRSSTSSKTVPSP
jgi:hypothetical protein